MNNINPKIVNYIEKNIIPQYDAFDGGHDRQHAYAVIKIGLEIASSDELKDYNIDKDMVYVVCACHDIGLKYGRHDHSIRSKEMFLHDTFMSEFFSPEKMQIMGKAIEQHSTKFFGQRENVYGRILGDADNESLYDVIRSTYRLWAYRFTHMPDSTREEMFEDMMSFMENLHETLGNKLTSMEFTIPSLVAKKEDAMKKILDRNYMRKLSEKLGYLPVKEDPLMMESVENSIREIVRDDLTSGHFATWFFKIDDFLGLKDNFNFDMMIHKPDKKQYSYGYFSNNKLEGIIQLIYSIGFSRYHINMIYVNSSKQGLGIGQQLLKFVVDRFGHRTITIDPVVDNERAIHIYEKFGFRIIMTTVDDGRKMYLMERKPDDKESAIIESGFMNLKIDNSKEAAISYKGAKWSNPGAALYDQLLDSVYYQGGVPASSGELDELIKKDGYNDWKDFLKEAYLIAPIRQIKNTPRGRTPYSSSGCKYPHHVIHEGKLVVHHNGVVAAYKRAKQQGIFKGDVKDHLEKHYKELGIYEDSTISEKIEQNFSDIERYITEEFDSELLELEQKFLVSESERYGWMYDSSVEYKLENCYQIIFEKADLKYTYRLGYNAETGTPVAVEFELDSDKVTKIGDPTLTRKTVDGNSKYDNIGNKKTLVKAKHRNALEPVKNFIKNHGHLDHVTSGLKVHAIFDINKNNYTNIKLVPAFSPVGREIINKILDDYQLPRDNDKWGEFLKSDKFGPKFIQLLRSSSLSGKPEEYHVSKSDTDLQGHGKHKTTKLFWNYYNFSTFSLTPKFRGNITPKTVNKDFIKDPDSLANNYNIMNSPKKGSLGESLIIENSLSVDPRINDYEQHLDKWKKNSSTNILYVTGLGGGGKTYTSEKLAKEHNAMILALDDIFVTSRVLDNKLSEIPSHRKIGIGLTLQYLELHPELKIGMKVLLQQDRDMYNREMRKYILWVSEIIQSKYNDRLWIVEGLQIIFVMNPKFFKDKPVIVKGNLIHQRNNKTYEGIDREWLIKFIDNLSKMTNRKIESPLNMGFDFDFDEKDFWDLDIPITTIDISELEWHFTIPFWDDEPGEYNLKPIDVIKNPGKYPEHDRRVKNADTSYPLDILKNPKTGYWTLIDGLHRLVKLHLKDEKDVKVRKITMKDVNELYPNADKKNMKLVNEMMSEIESFNEGWGNVLAAGALIGGGLLVANRIKSFYNRKLTLGQIQKVTSRQSMNMVLPPHILGTPFLIPKYMRDGSKRIKQESYDIPYIDSYFENDPGGEDQSIYKDIEALAKKGLSDNGWIRWIQEKLGYTKEQVQDILTRFAQKYNVTVWIDHTGIITSSIGAVAYTTNLHFLKKFINRKNIAEGRISIINVTSSWSHLHLVFGPSIMNQFPLMSGRSVPKLLELVMAHEYGHILTWKQFGISDRVDYMIKSALLSILRGFFRSREMRSCMYMAYHHLPIEKAANDASGVKPEDLLKAEGMPIGSVSRWKNSPYGKVIYNVPTQGFTNLGIMNTREKDFEINDLRWAIDYSIKTYQAVLPPNMSDSMTNVLKEISRNDESLTKFLIDYKNPSSRETFLTVSQNPKSGKNESFSDSESDTMEIFESDDDLDWIGSYLTEEGEDPPSLDELKEPEDETTEETPTEETTTEEVPQEETKPVEEEKPLEEPKQEVSKPVETKPTEIIPESLPKRTDREEADKNGVRRKKLYIAFIEWCKEYNPKNTFGSVFDKEAFHSTYPFVPHEMRYFYRLANPMLCVLSGDLTFFALAELRKVNVNNSKLDEMIIFAATKNDVRVFSTVDKKVYRGTEENGMIKLDTVLGSNFDTYIQNMVDQGDILNSPLEESYDINEDLGIVGKDFT